jgi:hypothetical protein
MIEGFVEMPMVNVEGTLTRMFFFDRRRPGDLDRRRLQVQVRVAWSRGNEGAAAAGSAARWPATLPWATGIIRRTPAICRTST